MWEILGLNENEPSSEGEEETSRFTQKNKNKTHLEGEEEVEEYGEDMSYE